MTADDDPPVVTVTKCRLMDLPISFQDIKDATLELALQIQQTSPPMVQMAPPQITPEQFQQLMFKKLLEQVNMAKLLGGNINQMQTL